MSRKDIDRNRVAPGVRGEGCRRKAKARRVTQEPATRWMRASVALVGAAAAAMALGCSPGPSAAAAASTEKIYALHPESLRVEAGTFVANVVRMKVAERIEEHSGRVVSPARLTGRLFLENVSLDQSIHVIGGRIVYLDAKGEIIPVESGRAEPTLHLASGFGATGRLEPGKIATTLLYAEFPTAALSAVSLKTIRIKLEIAAVPTVTEEQVLNFPVSFATP